MTTLAWHFAANTLRDGRPLPPDGEMVPAKITKTDSREPKYLMEVDDGNKVWLPEAALASATLIERPLAVGDRVTHTDKRFYTNRGTILAIHEDEAWVKYINGDTAPIPLFELRRAEERG